MLDVLNALQASIPAWDQLIADFNEDTGSLRAR